MNPNTRTAIVIIKSSSVKGLSISSALIAKRKPPPQLTYLLNLLTQKMQINSVPDLCTTLIIPARLVKKQCKKECNSTKCNNCNYSTQTNNLHEFKQLIYL